MPRYMEDYDIEALDYCRHYFKPCKDVDIKYCYFKQLKRKEQECERLKRTLTEIKEIVSGNYEILDPQAKNEILQKISEAKNAR